VVVWVFFIALFCLGCMIGAISATVLICIKKWDLDGLYEVYIGGRWRLPPEFCFFCAGFWISGIQAGALAYFIPNIFYIALPFIAAPIAKGLYEKSRAT
jgi:hypothetical protein